MIRLTILIALLSVAQNLSAQVLRNATERAQTSYQIKQGQAQLTRDRQEMAAYYQTVDQLELAVRRGQPARVRSLRKSLLRDMEREITQAKAKLNQAQAEVGQSKREVRAESRDLREDRRQGQVLAAQAEKRDRRDDQRDLRDDKQDRKQALTRLAMMQDTYRDLLAIPAWSPKQIREIQQFGAWMEADLKATQRELGEDRREKREDGRERRSDRRH